MKIYEIHVNAQARTTSKSTKNTNAVRQPQLQILEPGEGSPAYRTCKAAVPSPASLEHRDRASVPSSLQASALTPARLRIYSLSVYSQDSDSPCEAVQPISTRTLARCRHDFKRSDCYRYYRCLRKRWPRAQDVEHI